MNKIFFVFFITMCIVAGCGASKSGYTREELGNLAKLELYEADSDTPFKTIEDEEVLYQFHQVAAAWADAYIAAQENTLQETAEEADETYYIVAYKYPVAKFGDKEVEKNMTITLYRECNIAKMTVDNRQVKNIDLPEEWMTFYYEMSEEESRFYASLTE